MLVCNTVIVVSMAEAIVKLGGSEGLSSVGGKAYSLARLINFGYHVPDCFVITTAAYDNMSTELESAILSSFKELGSPLVAVRSSAVNEDGQKDAWAGQFDTFLNVNESNLIDKITACWQSALSDRAKSYASQKGLEAGAVAVIVQKMINAEASGVAFSAHPVTNDLQKIVIEATLGLGDKLVSGEITPDTYIMDKETLTITESHILAKPMLDAAQLKEIGKSVSSIEQSFGFPVDVEWTWANGKLFIMQSRPITTLG